MTVSSATSRSPLMEEMMSGVPHTIITEEREQDKERNIQWCTHKQKGNPVPECELSMSMICLF